MRLPDFLIIGAMKAGTTTLFHDLMLNPRVFFPLDKEPEFLCRDEVLSEDGRRRYAKLFARARADQLCAEASTAYAKRPVYEGVPARALRALGGELKVLYIVRDPVKRMASQHRHEVGVGRLETRPDVNAAVREIGRYLDYSRYAMQLEPWLEAFGPERVRVIVFERYVGARARTIAAVSEFLGVAPAVEGLDEGRVYNRGDERRALRGPWRWLVKGSAYRRLLRPLLSGETRRRLRETLLPKAPAPVGGLTPETAEWAWDQLAADIDRFTTMLSGSGLLLPGEDPAFHGWDREPRAREVEDRGEPGEAHGRYIEPRTNPPTTH
ncbi:MAG TPA: sulfotransferase domain-containing protein [Phycisphaerales bacterium]|nr:sulfotransferase domain-containing protein [Phycisphaerales bacterium]